MSCQSLHLILSAFRVSRDNKFTKYVASTCSKFVNVKSQLDGTSFRITNKPVIKNKTLL